MLLDTHAHSDFSMDASYPLETMLQEALRKGLSVFTITDHFDPDYPNPLGEGEIFTMDSGPYLQEVLRLKEKYKGQIELLFGVELGLQPHVAEELRAWVQGLPLDFVIGSSHIVDGRDPYLPGFFDDRSEHDGYRDYFRTFLPNLAVYSDLSVYGHLDYVVRYGPNKDADYRPQDFFEILEPSLARMIELGIGVELNTAGWAKGLNMPHPHPDILKRYRELGGEIVTIGSDAHLPERIAYGFDRAKDLLRDLGFRYFTYFRERKPVFLPL